MQWEYYQVLVNLWKQWKFQFHKVSIFYELIFPKYVNFEIIGAGHIGLLTCLGWKEWDGLMKEKNYAALWIWKKVWQQKYAVAYENYDGKT